MRDVIDLAVGLLLQGYVSNTYGRIGVLISKYGRINHVYTHSPAADAGLERGDVVIDPANTNNIDGYAGTWVTLVVKRGDSILWFHVIRTSPQFVTDK